MPSPAMAYDLVAMIISGLRQLFSLSDMGIGPVNSMYLKLTLEQRPADHRPPFRGRELPLQGPYGQSAKTETGYHKSRLPKFTILHKNLLLTILVLALQY